MKFYHGGTSRPFLKKCREIAPSLTHGYGFSPQKCLDRPDEPYFVDNGAFTSSFNESNWIETLEKIDGFKSEPDFIVLPDVFDDPKATYKRSCKYVDLPRYFDLSYYYVAQKPAKPETIIRQALELEASGVFIGGSFDWKFRNTRTIVDLAHKNNLKCHIGMPKKYYWAYRTGADSMDSVSIALNRDISRLQRLEDMVNGTQTKIV